MWPEPRGLSVVLSLFNRPRARCNLLRGSDSLLLADMDQDTISCLCWYRFSSCPESFSFIPLFTSPYIHSHSLEVARFLSRVVQHNSVVRTIILPTDCYTLLTRL